MAEHTVAIKVDNVSKHFKLPHEKQSSIKGALISRFKGNRQSYETQQALKNVSFEIEKGEFFGIVGRNGGGKSTLLKMLAGIYAPSNGSISINGKLTPFIELGVGFRPELSGRENVFLNGALLGFSREEMSAMYDDIVSFAELGRFMDQKLKNYSSGMQVRLAFSIAIRARSDILLLDEVLAVGDAAFQQKCFNYFEDLKRAGKTVVFVSHDMGAVRRFCSKAVYIKQGELIASGSAGEIADLYLEENIEHGAEPVSSKEKISKECAISAKITKQTDSAVEYEISFTSPHTSDEQMYVGLSLLKEGIPVAEIATSSDKSLTGSGKVTYSLDTTIFNGGIYDLTAALFRADNRQLLAYDSKRSQFVIKGSDINRGAAVKLKDAWRIQ